MADASPTGPDYARRHARFGWWSLLVFLILGFTLELLHGFKVGVYLDPSNATRRLLWTLAHAHGALLGLVHVVFGISLRVDPARQGQHVATISICLMAASVLLPGGFFLGGAVVYGGDPGLGVVGAPVGGALLIFAVYLIARRVSVNR